MRLDESVVLSDKFINCLKDFVAKARDAYARGDEEEFNDNVDCAIPLFIEFYELGWVSDQDFDNFFLMFDRKNPRLSDDKN